MSVDRSAAAWVRRIIDPGSWSAWHQATDPPSCGCVPANEIRSGRARVDGVPVAVIVVGGEGGVPTLTAHAAAQIAGAFEHALEARLPVVAVAASGGVRLQEGTRTFVAMAGVAAAVSEHRDAGLLFLCYYADPCIGGTLVSWAGLAAVRAAEPGARIAFVGPRVVELTTGRTMPSGACTAESLLHNGSVDVVTGPERLRALAGAVLRGTVAADRPERVEPPDARGTPEPPADVWAAIERTRDAARPGIEQLIDLMEEPVELRGDGLGGGDDPTVRALLGRLRGRKLIVVGHDRSVGPERAAVTPAGLRKAARALELAGRLGVPLVSVVDTPGARADAAGEAGGIAFHVAAALAERARTEATLVSVLLGEGGGGAALAFLPAQITIAAESAWLAPLPPEGASAVLHRTPDQAAEVVAGQHVTSADLVKLGVVDMVVREEGNWIERIADAIVTAIPTA